MFLILVGNTVLLYLCDTEEAALHQIVLNIIERKLSQNGLTLHQHTELHVFYYTYFINRYIIKFGFIFVVDFMKILSRIITIIK